MYPTGDGKRTKRIGYALERLFVRLVRLSKGVTSLASKTKEAPTSGPGNQSA